MTVTFTVPELCEAVRAVAKEKPDFQYDADTLGINGSCVYFRYGEPSCIIGQGLSRLGFTQNDVGEFNENSDVFDLLKGLKGEDIRNESLDFLFYVQDRQDAGYPWGQCVHWADRRMREDE